jgi:hypothetical protein
MHIDQDMFADVAKAIYAGNLYAATQALNLMRALGDEQVATLLIRARQVSHPLPPLPEMAVAVPLPQPGADARVLFGGPDPRGPRVF